MGMGDIKNQQKQHKPPLNYDNPIKPWDLHT